jgi:hypothetical protein
MVVLNIWIVILNPEPRVLCPLGLELLDSSNVIKISAQSSENFDDRVPFSIMLVEVGGAASEKIVNIARRASSSDATIACQIERYAEMVWSRGTLPLPISPVKFIFLSNIFVMLVTCCQLMAACLS